MKKFIAIAIAVLFATTATAQFHHHYPQQVIVRDNGNWAAPLIGGVILGAVIANANAQNQQAQQPVIQSQVVIQRQYYSCLVQVYDPSTNTARNEVMTCVK
jgi:hypothetical protein